MKNQKTMLEMKAEQYKLKRDYSDLAVKIKILDEIAPKGGISVNWTSESHDKEQYEFRYRGSKKQLKKIVDHLMKKK